MEKDKSKNRIRKYILFLSLTLHAGMLFLNKIRFLNNGICKRVSTMHWQTTFR